MAVTITYPPLNGKCGPGFLVYAQSSFIGPIGANSYWNVRLYDSTLVSIVAGSLGADFAKSVSCVMGVMRPTPGSPYNTQYFFNVNPIDARALDGAAGKLVVELIDGATFGVIDTITQNVVIDLQQGVPTMFTYLEVVLRQGTVGVNVAAILNAVRQRKTTPGQV